MEPVQVDSAPQPHSKVSLKWPTVVVVALIFGGVAGFQLRPTPTIPQAVMNELVPESTGQAIFCDTFDYCLKMEDCSSQECVFKNLNMGQFEGDYFGNTTLTGYYSVTQEQSYGDKVECENFTFELGPENRIVTSLLDEYEWMRPTTGTKVTMHISTSEAGIFAQEKAKIASSSSSNPVTIVVARTYPEPVGSPACWSPFSILAIKQ